MIKLRSENFKKIYGVEVIKTVNTQGQIRAMVSSNSQLFLDGISSIIQGKIGNLKVITEASGQNIESSLIETKPQFLLLDNRSFRLNINNLLSFIAENGLDTKVILLSRYTEYGSNLFNIIYLNRETSSAELISIINRESLNRDNEDGAKRSRVS